MSIEDAKRAALTDFEEFRNLAMHHSHLKAECYNKARDAFQRKQTGVAYYYTTVANLHNAKIDMYNHKAANAIVEVHSYTQQDPNMLDLHYVRDRKRFLRIIAHDLCSFGLSCLATRGRSD